MLKSHTHNYYMDIVYRPIIEPSTEIVRRSALEWHWVVRVVKSGQQFKPPEDVDVHATHAGLALGVYGGASTSIHHARLCLSALRPSLFFEDTAPMELRHLRYFVAVAQERHFSRAAQRVGIEQSPLSRAIRTLEQDLGVRLLERSTRGSKLTAAGEVFLQHALAIVASADRARLAARATAEIRSESL